MLPRGARRGPASAGRVTGSSSAAVVTGRRRRPADASHASRRSRTGARIRAVPSPADSDSGAESTSTYCGHFVGQTRRNANPMTNHRANTRCRRQQSARPTTARSVIGRSTVTRNVPRSWNGTEPISQTSGCHDGQPVSWTAALVA